MQFLYEKSTNAWYSINELVSNDPRVSEDQPVLVIFGIRFQLDKSHSKQYVNDQISKLISNVAWFSYRKNFEPIIRIDNSKKITNDSGWGCMVRSGQMLLFVFLLKLKTPEKFFLKKPIDETCFSILREFFEELTSKIGDNKIELNEINSEKKESWEEISSQNDKASFGKNKIKLKREIGIFALQNFVKTAKMKYNLNEGSWFRPTTFLLALKQIIKNREQFAEIRIYNIFENIFSLKSLCKKAFKNYESLEVKSVDEAVQILSTKDWDRTILLNICTMLGMGTIDPKWKVFLQSLVEIDSFVGMLGGYQQRAFYFIGCNSDLDFYYLDPHYVRNSLINFENEQILKEEYFKKTFMKINYTKLSSSLSLSYLIRSKRDFEKFWKILKNLENLYQDEYFMAYFLDKPSDEPCNEDDIIIL